MKQTEYIAAGRPSRSQGQQPDLIRIGAIFGSLWRHAWIIVLTTALGVGLAYHYAFNVATPLYEAKASILLDTRERAFISFDETTGTLSRDTVSLNTEVGVLRGPDLLRRVVETLNLDQDPEFNPLLRREQAADTPEPEAIPESEREAREALGADIALRILLGRLQVRNLPNSLIFEIGVSTADPQKSMNIANTVAELYIAEQIERKVRETARASSWLQTRVSELQDDLQEAESRIEEFRFRDSGDRTRLERLTSEAESIRTVYRYLLTRLQETTAQEGLQRADSRLLSSALMPLGPTSPRQNLLLAVGAALGLFLGLVIIFIKESMDHSIRSRDRLEAIADRPVIAELPYVGPLKRRSRVKGMIGDRALAYNAALDNLITMESLMRPIGEPLVIVITSPEPGDGKTTLALSAAHRLAARGAKTLLIDADTRKRKLSRQLGLRGVGLLGVLAGEILLEEAVRRPDGLGTDVLICENRTGNRSQFTSPQNVQALVQAARASYDFVLIVTPPILAVPDALTFGKVADRIALLVRWKGTRAEEIEASMNMFRDVDLGEVSLVMNRVPASGLSRQQYSDYLRTG